MHPTTLLEHLEVLKNQDSSKPALTLSATGQTWTRGDVHDLACRMRSRLSELALKPKSTIALLSDSHPLVFPLLAACAANGLRLTLINPRLHAREIHNILSHSEAKLVLVGEASLLESSRPPAREWSALLLDAFLNDAAQATPTSGPELGDVNQTALLIYTSGSTGLPKGVMLSQRALLANAKTIGRLYGLGPEDRTYCVLPLYHMNAIMITGLVPLLAGAHSVISKPFSHTNAKFYWEHVAKWKITVCSLAPSLMSMLLRLHPAGTGQASLSVRFCFCGAAPLPRTVWQDFETVFGIPVYQGYGLTETACWAVMTPPDVQRNYDSVGVPQDCEVSIDKTAGVAEENLFSDRRTSHQAVDGERRTRSGTIALGEVVIRGPLLMEGYFKNKVLTTTILGPPGLRTGDVGYFDRDGCLHIVGRIKEVIIKNGENILPNEIDEVLSEFPGILTCKTIGLPHDVVGESICSVCVFPKDASRPTADVLRSFLRERLAPFKVPDRIVFMRALPSSETGKLKIGELRQILTGELADQLYERIDTRKYRRSPCTDKEAFIARIQGSLVEGEEIHFLSYWGCGRRAQIDDVDRKAIDRLDELVSELRRPNLSVTLTLVFTDLHGMINGKPVDRIREYFQQVEEYATEAGFRSMKLSEIWKAAGFDSSALLAAGPPIPSDALVAYEAIAERLVEQATKHTEGDEPDRGARRYFAACQYDAKAIETQFPKGIFLTYNDLESRPLLPRLPMLHIYSYGTGHTDKPWFM